MLRVITVLLLALGALVLAACSQAEPAAANAGESSSTTAVDAPAGAAINEVVIKAVEYAYEAPDTIPAGWTRLTLDNQGALAHDLIPVRIEEGKTVEDVMAALEAEGPPAWATMYGQVTAEPGQSASYLADLAPGSYVIFSFGESEDGPPDAAQGMIDTLTVTAAEGGAAQAALPQADVTIDLVDYSFVIEGDIETGEQLLQISNPGTELHEMVVFRLNEGTSLADFQTLLASEEEPESEPPFQFIYSTMLSPGVSTYVPVAFDEPGNYVLVCFFPSEQNQGMSHHELGMMQEITVQ